MSDVPEPLKPKPASLLKKTVSGANWGMLAGFWVELPLMAAFLFKPFKPKDLAGWAKVSEWSVKLVLPSTLLGVVYGFTKPDRERVKQQRSATNEPVANEESFNSLAEKHRRSWAEWERMRLEQDTDSHIQL